MKPLLFLLLATLYGGLLQAADSPQALSEEELIGLWDVTALYDPDGNPFQLDGVDASYQFTDDGRFIEVVYGMEHHSQYRIDEGRIHITGPTGNGLWQLVQRGEKSMVLRMEDGQTVHIKRNAAVDKKSKRVCNCDELFFGSWRLTHLSDQQGTDLREESEAAVFRFYVNGTMTLRKGKARSELDYRCDESGFAVLSRIPMQFIILEITAQTMIWQDMTTGIFYYLHR